MTMIPVDGTGQGDGWIAAARQSLRERFVSATPRASIADEVCVVGRVPPREAQGSPRLFDALAPSSVVRQRPTASTRAAAPPAATTAVPGAFADEPLPAADHVWLRLPNMVIKAVLQFDERVSREAIEHLARTRLTTIDRFNQALVSRGEVLPVWSQVEGFDPASHVRVEQVPPETQDEALWALLDRLGSAPLDMKAPLWDMTLIDRPDGGSHLLVRVHHAVADGPRLVAALMCCHDGPRPSFALPTPSPKAASRGRWGAMVERCRAVTTFVGTLLLGAFMALRSPDPRTSVKHGEISRLREVRFSRRAWSVAALKAAAKRRGGGTLNDVLVCAITGGVRRYLQRCGDRTERLALRCLQTVNMGVAGPARGNSVSTGICTLPVHVATRQARFTAVRRAMVRLKRSAEPYVAARVTGWVGWLPAWLTRFLYRRVTNQCSIFLSNVHGPTQPVRIAGHKVTNVAWFGPPFGNIALEFPVISYGDRLNLGVVADRGRIRDAELLQTLVEDELAQLCDGDEANSFAAAAAA